MSQCISHRENGSAEARNSDATTVDQPAAIQLIDCTLVSSHLAGSFLCRQSVRAVVPVGRPSDLKDYDACACQGLRGKGAAPGTVDPKLVGVKSVRLNHKWMTLLRVKVRRQIESTLHFMSVRGLPGDGLNLAKTEPCELWVQVQQQSLLFGPLVDCIDSWRQIHIFFKHHIWPRRSWLLIRGILI